MRDGDDRALGRAEFGKHGLAGNRGLAEADAGLDTIGRKTSRREPNRMRPKRSPASSEPFFILTSR